MVKDHGGSTGVKVRGGLIEIFHELLLEDLIVDSLERWLGVSPLPDFLRQVAHDEAVKIYRESQERGRCDERESNSLAIQRNV